jgi:acetyl-CoA C-acetyltransferase
MKEVYIVSAVRTPLGSFLGSLSSVSATKLGAAAIKGAFGKINLKPEMTDEVFMGNVLSAGLGQAPARQAALFAGVPDNVPCTTINKVCSSGMKALMFGAQSIMLGDNDVVVAGGMENMSQVPHYVPGMRTGQKLGDGKLQDGMIKDGLWDVYNDYHMGNAAELCAKEKNFSREEQDRYAVQSYKRAESAVTEGRFKEEIVPVEISTRKGKVLVDTDEEYKNVRYEKVPSLRPVFQKDGTVTAANASSINDGASAVILVSGEKLKELGLKPLAKIIGYGDYAQAPEWFTTSPAGAVKKALEKAGLKQEQIQYYEINEAFAAVALAAVKDLGLDESRVNVNGGGISLGHPLGASGARISVTLLNVLKQNKAKYGVAALCNGGGGASALVIENLA